MSEQIDYLTDEEIEDTSVSRPWAQWAPSVLGNTILRLKQERDDARAEATLWAADSIHVSLGPHPLADDHLSRHLRGLRVNLSTGEVTYTPPKEDE